MIKLTDYLKEQLIDFVDVYKKYYLRTLGTTLAFSILCFVGAALLLKFGNLGTSSSTNQSSLVSYFYFKRSTPGSYAFVDLTKALFIFFIAMFSLGISKLVQEKLQDKEFSFSELFKKIKLADIIILITVLGCCAILDYLLYNCDNYFTQGTPNISFTTYVKNLISQLRIYTPLILFALTIHSLTKEKKSKFTFKRILFLYISLWLFNEFSYEFLLWTRVHIWGLILPAIKSPERYYVFETILGIPLIAFYFLGFHSAMTTSLKLTEERTEATNTIT
jgi:hypothetical protein